MENYISEEETKIIQLTKDGFTEKEIAEKLDSFPEAIKTKRENMYLREKGIIVWTDKNIQTLKFLISNTEDDNEIAEIMGDNKTKESIRSKRDKLRLESA